VIYHADRVPIGEDQLPHLELTREIVRRFNFIYGENTLREPKEILTEAARVLGIDGRKMSKSYGNAIFVYETEETLKNKVMQMFTDVKRLRRKDPGEPRDCNLYPLHEYFTDEATRDEIQVGCRSAGLGCVDCKKILLGNLIREFAPVWEKIDYYRSHANVVDDVLAQGAARAIKESDATMEKVRMVMKLVG
jgi:tryptophanyl-tRNA synthetase